MVHHPQRLKPAPGVPTETNGPPPWRPPYRNVIHRNATTIMDDRPAHAPEHGTCGLAAGNQFPILWVKHLPGGRDAVLSDPLFFRQRNGLRPRWGGSHGNRL